MEKKKKKKKVIVIDDKWLLNKFAEYRKRCDVMCRGVWSYDAFMEFANIRYMDLEALKVRVRVGDVNALACFGVLKDIKRKYLAVLGDILVLQYNHSWVRGNRYYDLKHIQYLHKRFSDELVKDEEISIYKSDADVAPILENKSGIEVKKITPVKVKVIP